MNASSLFPLARGTQFTSGNSVTILVDAEEFLPAMVRAIDSAHESVSFQFLNMEADAGGLPIAEALIRASRRGVEVKGILDQLCLACETNGEWAIWPSRNRKKPHVMKERKETWELFDEMRVAGINLQVCRPGFQNSFTRNHRKSLIVDHQILIVGGFNPTDHNRQWHEVCVEVEGDAAIHAQTLFNNLFEETGNVGISRRNGHVNGGLKLSGAVKAEVGLVVNDPKRKESFREVFLRAVEHAQSSFRIENAYFSDLACAQALANAARRGVKVQLIVPKRSNHPSVDQKGAKRFPLLLEAGVEVYQLRRMTHAKVFSIDDEWISIGSANLTRLNLRTERELNVMARDADRRLGKDLLDRVFLPDILESDRVER
jgi:cardiolipin synthase A/B